MEEKQSLKCTISELSLGKIPPNIRGVNLYTEDQFSFPPPQNSSLLSGEECQEYITEHV